MKRPNAIFILISAVSLFVTGDLFAADAAKGQALYAAKCAMCHAKDLKGNPAMAKMYKIDQSKLNLIGKDTLDKKDEELIAVTTKGKGKMPAQEKKLKPEEIADIIAYVRSMGSSAAEKSK